MPSLQFDNYITKLNHSLECVIDIARTTLKSLVDKRCKNNPTETTQFKPHDLVLRKIPVTSSKLCPVWQGPFRVISRDDQSYVLENLFGTTRVRAFLSQLKSYFSEDVDSTMIATLRRDPLLLRSHMIIDHKGDLKCPRSLLFAVVYKMWKFLKYHPELFFLSSFF